MGKIIHGKYAKLTEDFAFKKVFASEEAKELLIALLNAFLERKLVSPIKEVFIKNPYIKGQSVTNRDAVLDIHCEDSCGNRFIVEMQLGEQEHFVKRAIFYLCISVANSGKKGKGYDFNFPRAYSLNFLDFELDFGKDCDEMVQYFSMRNDDHPEVVLDCLSLVFVILPRFKKRIEECKTLQDKLMFSLCHAHELERVPKQLRNGLFERLFSIAKISNFSAMEYSEYTSRMMARADRKAQMEFAVKKGVEKGMQQGIAEGEARGEARGMEKGMQKIIEYLKQGHSIAEAEALLKGQ